MSPEDRTTITDLIHLHGHLADRGDFDGFRRVFTDDVIYDASALGGGVLAGLATARDAALELGDRNPVGHHVTNVVLTDGPDGSVRAASKAIGVMADGSVASLVYEDVVERTPAGWRITHRVIRPRLVPLQP